VSIISTTKMTAEQFLQLGEDPPGVKLELVDGEVAVSPSPIPRHSFVVVKLASLLDSYVSAHRLGQLLADVDTVLGRHDVRRPDLIYFSTARLNLISEQAINGPPDLCVEIVSPSSQTIDRQDKFGQYAKSRVAFYWIVDPAKKTIEGYRLVKGKYVPSGKGKGSDVVRLGPFDDLEIPLQKLWWQKA
jgi:Uma2 family endonuclease